MLQENLEKISPKTLFHQLQEKEIARRIAIEKSDLSLSLKNSIKNEAKLNSLLKEFLNLEESFTKNAGLITSLFQALIKHYPEENIFQQYAQHLEVALPYFEGIYNQSQSFFQDSTLNVRDKIERVAGLYCAEIYYQLLSHLIFLYPKFELWGGDYEYERLVEASQRVSPFVSEGIEACSPALFIQRLPQMNLIVNDWMKHTDSSVIKSLSHTIKESIEGVYATHRKRVMIEDVFLLLNSSGEITEGNRKKAVQLFIENRLYADPNCAEINEEVKTHYPIFFQDLFFSLFKQIEGVKNKMRERPSRQLEIFNHTLKERLLAYLEYARDVSALPGMDIESWSYLAHHILDEAPLTYPTLKSRLEEFSDKKKLSLMKCFADFLTFLKNQNN